MLEINGFPLATVPSNLSHFYGESLVKTFIHFLNSMTLNFHFTGWYRWLDDVKWQTSVFLSDFQVNQTTKNYYYYIYVWHLFVGRESFLVVKLIQYESLHVIVKHRWKVMETFTRPSQITFDIHFNVAAFILNVLRCRR